MKILHVSHGYVPESIGGVETYLRGLLPRQRDAGSDATLFTGSMVPWRNCGLEEWNESGVPGLRLHRDDLFFDHHAKAWHPGASDLFAASVARLRPDLVHLHHWIRLSADLVERADELGVPAVITLHDVYTTCPRAFRVDRAGQPCARPAGVVSCLPCVPRYGHESAEELAEGIELFFAQTRSELLRARALVVPDATTADLVAAQRDLPRERFTVVPMPYEPRFPGQRRPWSLPAPDEPLRLGYFGGVARHKGVAVLVEAFARATRAGLRRKLELHVHGREATPEFTARLDALAAGLPVYRHGAYDHATLARAGLHAAVFPSLAFETFGFVLDEAFELGLPVLVSDLGALSHRAGAAALRVPAGDVDAWQQAITALARDPAPLAALAANIPPPPPGWDAHLQALAAIYAQALGTDRRPAPAVPAARRIAFLLRQRESALARLTPPGGPD